MLKIGIALIATILLSAQAPAQILRPTQPTTNQQNTAKRITLNKIQGAPNPNSNSSDKKKNEKPASSWRDWFATSDHWIVIGTLILAAAAIFQVEIARRTAKRQLRAYVMPDVATVADYGGIQPPPSVAFVGHAGSVVVIKNSGQTPAYDLLHWNNTVILPLTEERSLFPPAKLLNIGPTTLGPGCVIHKAAWSAAPITSEEIAAVKAGISAIFVYGKITYRDAFNRKRETTYRLSYSGNYPPVQNAALHFCVGGNRAT